MLGTSDWLNGSPRCICCRAGDGATRVQRLEFKDGGVAACQKPALLTHHHTMEADATHTLSAIAINEAQRKIEKTPTDLIEPPVISGRYEVDEQVVQG